ncbi:hypothetical protein RYA05_31575 [Pseudomonas syringae pv. actinidiae]|uniref:hypothetical protein n=1 Tax=Pseudomonas syringae TaxID=317 RepID=UPI0002094F7A|nr:hypothetical protein [Pseudomonas syringae]EPN55745.1 putative Tn5504 transposase [Pseudomonas syringae pv. actinidiae ICMP 19079]EPN86424.1 putative Tn5504 transposase [Pseudomonas syringae pv. actinidiae ICMP 19101]AKT28612.1 transposase [Pseudomonas syringae pv. actinidiae ICMP 18884]AOE55149.1 transposase [Pseudomonas syringae pv. actinidiae ICMP 18708]APP96011.1 transposase [Pseudomonas syringae pv. actinidiae]
MIHKNKLISVLSDAEQEALYGLPDFDDGQRLEFLSLSETAADQQPAMCGPSQ